MITPIVSESGGTDQTLPPKYPWQSSPGQGLFLDDGETCRVRPFKDGSATRKYRHSTRVLTRPVGFSGFGSERRRYVRVPIRILIPFSVDFNDL